MAESPEENYFPLGDIEPFLEDGPEYIDHLFQTAAIRVEPVRHERVRESLEATDAWRQCFDGLELLAGGASVLIDACADRYEPDSLDHPGDQLRWTLLELAAASELVAQEALVLLNSGFPTGARTRWRTLFELHVCAVIIAAGGDEAASRFSEHETMWRSRHLVLTHRNLKKHKIQPLPSDVVRAHHRNAEEIRAKYEPEFTGDQGWAHAHMLETSDRYRGRWEAGERSRGPTFAELRVAAGLDVFVADYDLASAGVHASARTRHAYTPLDEGPPTVGPASGGTGPTGVCIAQATIGPLVELVKVCSPSHAPDHELINAVVILQDLSMRIVREFQAVERAEGEEPQEGS